MLRNAALFRSRIRQIALLVVCLVGVAVPAWAQGTGASITGVITDAQGGVLPGVTLTARNIETGIIRTSVTETDGQYRLVALPPGRYDLTAELQGFACIAP